MQRSATLVKGKGKSAMSQSYNGEALEMGDSSQSGRGIIDEMSEELDDDSDEGHNRQRNESSGEVAKLKKELAEKNRELAKLG